MEENTKPVTYSQTLIVFTDGTEERLYTSDYFIQDKQFIVFDTRTTYVTIGWDVLKESFTKVKMHIDNIAYIRVFTKTNCSDWCSDNNPDMRIKFKQHPSLDIDNVNCVYTNNPFLVIDWVYDLTLIPFKNIISQEFFRKWLL